MKESLAAALFALANLAGCGSFSPAVDKGGAVGLCTNQERDGDESDVDCGGLLCSPCAIGRSCGAHGDCEARTCVAGVCAGPACDDQVRNGTETDVDCGGGLCPRCKAGQ